jgi:hypothetical protein
MTNHTELRKQLEEKKINLMLELNHVNGQLLMMEQLTAPKPSALQVESKKGGRPKGSKNKPREEAKPNGAEAEA